MEPITPIFDTERVARWKYRDDPSAKIRYGGDGAWSEFQTANNDTAPTLDTVENIWFIEAVEAGACADWRAWRNALVLSDAFLGVLRAAGPTPKLLGALSLINTYVDMTPQGDDAEPGRVDIFIASPHIQAAWANMLTGAAEDGVTFTPELMAAFNGLRTMTLLPLNMEIAP